MELVSSINWPVIIILFITNDIVLYCMMLINSCVMLSYVHEIIAFSLVSTVCTDADVYVHFYYFLGGEES